MLQLRPGCEQCNAPLPPNADNAMICSYECTFCRHCVETVLLNVCPNCGGGFCPRPARIVRAWKNDTCLASAPAVEKITYKPVDPAQHALFAAPIRLIPPNER